MGFSVLSLSTGWQERGSPAGFCFMPVMPFASAPHGTPRTLVTPREHPNSASLQERKSLLTLQLPSDMWRTRTVMRSQLLKEYVDICRAPCPHDADCCVNGRVMWGSWCIEKHSTWILASKDWIPTSLPFRKTAWNSDEGSYIWS